MAAVRQLRARVAPSAPSDSARHVRVGVVHRGRIIEEQLLAPERSITVGAHPRSSVLLPGDGGPPDRLELFHHRGGTPHLRLSPGIRGKVDLGEGVVTLDSLSARGPLIPLPPTARGKVQVGEFTLLFQLVDPPARPVGGRGGSLRWNDVDWIFLALVVLSSLVHAAAVVWIQSQPPPSRAELVELGHELTTVFMPAPETDATPAPTDPDDASPSDPETPSPAPADRAPTDVDSAAEPEPAPEDPAPGEPAPADPERDLEAEAQQHGLLLLIGGVGQEAVQGVVDYNGDPSQISDTRLREALADGRVRVARERERPGLKGPDTVGDGVATIGEVDGVGGCATCPAPIQKDRRVPKVPEIVTTPPILPDGDFDIMPFLKRLRPSFKACYERALKADPDLAGRVSLSFVTDSAARVSDAWVEVDSMGSATANACMLKSVRRLSLPQEAADLEVREYGLVFTAQ